MLPETVDNSDSTCKLELQQANGPWVGGNGAHPETAALKRQVLPINRRPRLDLAQPPRSRLGQHMHVDHCAAALLAGGLGLALRPALFRPLRSKQSLSDRVCSAFTSTTVQLRFLPAALDFASALLSSALCAVPKASRRAPSTDQVV